MNILRTALLISTLALSNGANAAYFIEAFGKIKGIGDLDIYGTLYNVDFDAPGGFTTFGALRISGLAAAKHMQPLWL